MLMLCLYQGHIYRRVEARTAHNLTSEYLRQMQRNDYVRLAYPTTAPNWNVAKRQMQQATQQIAAVATLCKHLEQEPVQDFFRYINSTDQIRFWAGRLAKSLEYPELLTGKHAVEHAQAYREPAEYMLQCYDDFEQEIKQYYRGCDETLDPQDPRPKDPDNKKYWEINYQFTRLVLPLLQTLLQIKPALLQILKFAQYVEAYGSYQHTTGDPNASKSARPPTAQATEIMWHATTAYPIILHEGFKYRSEQVEAVGLGGSTDTKEQSEAISFTASPEIAEGIVEGLHDLVAMLQGPKDVAAVQRYCAKSLQLNYDLYMARMKELFSTQPNATGHYTLDQIFQFVEYGLSYAEREGLRYDPLFWHTSDAAEKMSKVKPENIGIIEAVIDTTEAHYFRGMEEWRVPKASILSFGPMGSQQVQA